MKRAHDIVDELGPVSKGGKDGKAWLTGIKAAAIKKWATIAEYAKTTLMKMEVVPYKRKIDEAKLVCCGLIALNSVQEITDPVVVELQTVAADAFATYITIMMFTLQEKHKDTDAARKALRKNTLELHGQLETKEFGVIPVSVLPKEIADRAEALRTWDF